MDIRRFFKKGSQQQEARGKGADAEAVSIEVSKGLLRATMYFGHIIVQRNRRIRRDVANVAF